jgi:hypothetical protein
VNVFALAAAALAVAQAPAIPVEGHYQCEAASNGGESMAFSATLYADGGRFSAFGSWYGLGDPRHEQLAIHWQLLDDLTIHRAYVNVTVPLSRKLEGIKILRLLRDDAIPGVMTLSATAAPGPVERQATASVDLQTLLDYAGGGNDALSWELGSAQYGATASERGRLDLAPLRAASAKAEALLGELTAKITDFRARCTYDSRPVPDE